ncbi:MAG: NAD(P)/FAD-dependent oxidoreductase [Candidatus Aenigmatarchaeota archaeon]
MEMYDTVIIGAGVAGMTSAIYASRNKMDFVVLSKNFAGQLNMAGEVKNLTFFTKTDWKELRERLKKQIDYHDIDFEREKATKVIDREEGFEVETEEGSYKGKTVIVATGAEPKKLSIPGAAKLTNKGVEYSAVSDAPRFEGEDVGVIGGGNSAAEVAHLLSTHATNVYILNINDCMDCKGKLKDEIKNDSNIEIVHNAETTEILGDERVQGLKYEKNGEEKKLDVKGVFPAIGMQPQTDFVRGFLDTDPEGHIMVDRHCRTSIDGIYAAGDCTNIHKYQLSVAIGHGAIALLKAVEHIREEY